MPTIIKYPNKTYYVVGEDTNIYLTCKSDGNPKPNYHWYKENHNERISTSENLTIVDMNKTNSGVYTCTVSNTFNGGTYTNSANVRVDIINKGNKAGLLGDNGTETECSYTQENIILQLSESFMAFNKSSSTFETIATYIPDQTPLLNTKGQYLKGRVTLTTIIQLSTKAVMTFNKLMCIDGTFYKCRVVTVEDNQAVIRCVVSSLAEENMYVESEPLDVKFAVKMPTIVKHPNKHYYLEGLDTSISLNCTTDGNPKPNYLGIKTIRLMQ
ncbi:unnamed protein product [Mytilus coruscus]|uniref:Ig-like domain-containing protein n=1 Tax=Mytilus coruscus TaxID=42192 RepID=A0A6J8BYQ7_MYTCO|nr:unnamed protein product [Mytilus coruscus]